MQLNINYKLIPRFSWKLACTKYFNCCVVEFCFVKAHLTICTGIEDWRVLVRAAAAHQVRNVGVRASQQDAPAALLHTPLRKLWINYTLELTLCCIPF